MVKDRLLPRVAWPPVAVVGAVMVALLVATIDRYGYHRDELYFRVLAGHPAWGYVDEPPLTPMLAKLGIAVFGDHLWSIRIPSILCALAILLLVVLLTREFGGATGAQVLAAAGACCSLVLVAGHLLSTATVDLVVWLLVILFAVRALLRGQPRWWLAAGVSAGLGMYNKQLVVLLLIGLLAGLLIAGPRAELRSPWLWAGAGIALRARGAQPRVPVHARLAAGEDGRGGGPEQGLRRPGHAAAVPAPSARAAAGTDLDRRLGRAVPGAAVAGGARVRLGLPGRAAARIVLRRPAVLPARPPARAVRGRLRP